MSVAKSPGRGGRELPEGNAQGSRQRAPRPEAVASNRAVPVKVWAAFGAAILAFEAFILVKWVTGEHFERVDPGPSPMSSEMQTAVDVVQWISIPIALVVIYLVGVRPWLRERRVTSDGLLCGAFVALSFQDPMSSYFGHWFAYNASLFNRGSWVYEMPGWTAFGEPGAELAQPLLVFTPLYVFVFLGLAMFGCFVMRQVKRRIPRVGVIGQLFVCWFALSLTCIVIEGFVYLRLGIYTYAGGHWPLFGDSYYKLPLHEILLFGALFTPMAALRYFVNDRGEYLAERGVDQLKIGTGRKTLLRFLALAAYVQVAMFCAYNLPGLWVGANSTRWPDDVQKRSYLTSGMCGEGTGRACPGEGVPLLQPKYLDGGTPRVVPIDR